MRCAPLALMVVTVVMAALPGLAAAEPASQPASPAAARLDVSGGGDVSGHACALQSDAKLRCWGYGGEGRLGYADTKTIGDDETPDSVGPVDLGPGRTATAISAGAFHTCALLDDAGVRCWGFGGEGRLGYADTKTIGDDETPGSVGPVALGPGRTATAISAGAGHTCALLDNASVRCWGFGSDGRLGYANRDNIGDNEPPGSAGPVDFGSGRTAKAISAGQNDACALLDDNSVRCWGFGGNGQLGYADNFTIGDDETPGSVGPVDLGPGRTATAISAGAGHTCALLDNASVRCWGFGGNGRLGYASTNNVGDDETPGSVGPVDLGPGRTAKAISAGDSHTCALLDDNSVRCWGFGADGRLGYASTNDVGDDETPGSVAPVDLGPGRTATAISAGGRDTCARLDDGSVRCWGAGTFGRLGYCNENSIGDDETPGSVGPIDLGVPGSPGAKCPLAAPPPAASPTPIAGRPYAPPGADPLRTQARRARALRGCRTRSARVSREARRRSREHRSARVRGRALRRAKRRAAQRLRACVKRFGRTPGRVTTVAWRATSKGKIVLSFRAPGSDGSKPPAARGYLIKQWRHPVGGARGFKRAHALCKGTCRFPAITRVGAEVALTVEDLQARTTYYYALAARDNVSGRLGPRSRTVKAKTR